MIELLKGAGQISTMWSLAAFAIGVILFLIQKNKKTNAALLWGSLAAITLVGIIPIAGSLYVQTNKDKMAATSVYRLRVTLLDPKSTPVDQAQVWSSIGGEPKRVQGGWEFDVPVQSKPANGKMTVYAAVPAAFLKGSQEVELLADINPAMTLRLQSDDSSRVRGMVTDDKGRSVAGASVSVVGYDTVQTDSSGAFVAPAHAAEGQQVQVHIEKGGYQAVTQWVPAGGAPVQFNLQRK